MTKFITKSGLESDFNPKKINRAITKAMKSGSGVYYPRIASLIAEEAEERFSKKDIVTCGEVDKFVLKKLFDYGQDLTANAYERYKTTKAYQSVETIIDKEVNGIIDGSNEVAIKENANKDGELASTQRDLIAGLVSRSYSERKLIPTHLLNAHMDGLIHIHDTDYLFNRIFNCCLINLKDMFANGTVINGKLIETPKSFQTACTVATQISLQVANGQYGGQTFSVAHLAPFVRVSFEKEKAKIRKEFETYACEVNEDAIEKMAWERTRDEVRSGVQTIQFQENTFSSANGQTPFVSIFMYLNEEPEYIEETAIIIEEMLKLRLLGMKNEQGVYVTPAFPKLLYVTDENNIHKDSEYRYLTDLAVKCSAKRMNPDYISAKMMRQLFDGQVFPCMGCRSFLAPWKDENGNYKFYGRFNRGVVTLNLVDVALSAGGDMEKFWGILDERLELVKEALIMRDRLLQGVSVNKSPIHWKYGALNRLKAPIIDELLHTGYSSISLGYIGIYEMCMAMLNKSNTTEEGSKFALDVMCYLEAKAKEWSDTITELKGCSLYGTPSESLCYKFALKTQKRFGKIKHITDRDWFTNSYHVCVCEPIDAFAKLSFESKFQSHSKGGAVSYVELPDLTNNEDALFAIIEHMYNTITYAEINLSNSDVCLSCGFEGELQIDDNGDWYCPMCGERHHSKLYICKRICGYLGNTIPNAGKSLEMKHRVKHL